MPLAWVGPTLPGNLNVGFALAFARTAGRVSSWDPSAGRLSCPGGEPGAPGGHWETTVALSPGSYAYLGRLRSFLERTFAAADVFEFTYGLGYGTNGQAASLAGAVGFRRQTLTVPRRSPAGLGPFLPDHQTACAPPAKSRRVCAQLAGSWWSQVPMARLHRFLDGFHRVFSQNDRVQYVDTAYVPGRSIPSRSDLEPEGAYRSCKLGPGSIHEMLEDFPTETELQEALKGLAAASWGEMPCYYWVLSYLAETDGRPPHPTLSGSGLQTRLHPI